MNKKNKLIIVSILGVISLLFILNFSIFSISPHLIGADINYHLGLTNLVNSGIYKTNPYFLEEANLYPIGIHFTISLLSQIFNLPLFSLWGFYVPIFATLFLIFFFLFVRNLWGNLVALISSLLLFCWNQILWPDPSSHLYGWFILSVSLFVFSKFIKNKDKKALFLSILLMVFLFWVHTEIFIHLLIVYSAYFLILGTAKTKRINKFKFKSKYQFDAKFLLALLLIIYALFFILIRVLIDSKGVGSGLIYNEIPLSLFYPFGIISLLICIMAVPSLLSSIDKKTKSDILVLSIAFLLTNSIFYFTYLWQVHHRYFSEVGFLGVIILASITLKNILRINNRKIRMGFLVIVLLFIALSIYPRYQFITNYSKQTEDSFLKNSPLLEWIKNNTEPFSVIAIYPEDILNRYVPGYSERFVLGAVGTITSERQWSVISTGCVTIGKENICVSRENITRQLFDNFSSDNLKRTRDKYELDYILAKKGENITVQITDKDYIEKLEYEDYILYSLKNETS